MASAQPHEVVVPSMEWADDAATPKQQRASRPVVLAVYAAMALTGGVGLAHVGKTRTATSPTSSRASTSLAEMAGASEEDADYQYGNNDCHHYDDDTVYTSDVCGSYDAGSCANQCQDGGWCSYFCTNSSTSTTGFGCNTGSGAICALKTLSDLGSTCRMVQSMNYTSQPNKWGLTNGVSDLGDAPVRSRPDTHRELQEGRSFEEQRSRNSSRTTVVNNEGCDEHVFCEYCDDTCQTIMNKKAIRLWGKAKYEYWFKTTGVGPFSMALLEDIVDLCELVYPDGVTEDDDESDTDTTEDDDESDTDTTVTTEHAHTESCGKGCSETVYDDDITTETTQGRPTSSTSTPVGSGNGDGFGKTVGETTTESPAPKDTDSSTTDSETEETEEEERAEHTDTAGHPVVSSPNWDTGKATETAAPMDTDSSTTDSETEETEEEERAEHTDTAGHPVVSSPNWDTGKATETAAPMDTDSSTTDSETEETEEEERAEHTDTDGHPIVSSPNWATAATSMAAAGVTGEAGSERATLAVVGAAFALVVAGVVAMRRRSRRGGAAAAYEPI